jgi:serine/threonine protein kinase
MSPAERRASERRRRRDAYFKNASSVSLVGGRDARIREEAFLGRALAPDRATLASRVFESSRMAPGAYAHAFARVCRELELGDVRGEGTFSDVYETRARRGRDENVRTFFAASAAESSAVIKCSVPFPGVVGGRTLGDGLGVGECEAGALAAMPAHPRVVEMLAAFLSADRNESYLLLADAGRCLHAARVEGEVTPLDARRHSRAVFEALAHCHAHGVVHRDVKAGNVLVSKRSDASSVASEEDFAVLIDFGVAKRPGVVDPEPPSRYGTPGYQAPELLMTDMRDAEADASGGRWFAVDIFALGCAMFFLCEGKELFGEPDRHGDDEDPLGAYGARTKTKARTQAEHEALEDAMARGDTFEPIGGEHSGGADFSTRGSDFSVSEKKARATKSRGFTTIDRRDRETFGGGGSENNAAFDLGSGKLAPAFLRALRRDVAVAAAEAELREAETDAAVLRAMAEFPGYEPRSDAESAFVAEMLGKRAVPGPPPRGRETLERFVARKLGKRQPAAFCSLVAACLARDPTLRPTAREALEWPGAWEGVGGFDAEEGEEEEEEERKKEAPGPIEGARAATDREGGPSIEDGAGGDAADGGAAAGRKSETCVDVV